MTKREQELQAQGWEKRTIIDDFRVADLVATYESLDFETLVEPLPSKEEVEESGDCGQCRACFDDEGVKERFKVIYTRRKDGAVGDKEENSS